MEEKIIITFTDDGPVVETQGVKGPKCMELTDPLERALGTVGDRKQKAEFYQQETAADRLQLRK